MPAADTIEVEVRSTTHGLRLPVRILMWTFMTVFVLIGFVITLVTGFAIADFVGMKEIRLVRRSDGEVLLKGDPPAFKSGTLAKVIRRDAERLDEAALLAKWGEPKEWQRILGTERY